MNEDNTTAQTAEVDRMAQLGAGIREHAADVWGRYTTLDPNDEDTREAWEEADEELATMAYGVGHRRVSSYVLAGGGPAANLRVEWELNNYSADIYSVTLELRDWFTGRDEEITDEDDPLYQIAQNWVDLEAQSQ